MAEAKKADSSVKKFKTEGGEAVYSTAGDCAVCAEEVYVCTSHPVRADHAIGVHLAAYADGVVYCQKHYYEWLRNTNEATLKEIQLGKIPGFAPKDGAVVNAWSQEYKFGGE